MQNKFEKNAVLVGLGAFLLLSFSVALTVALPLMQGELFAASPSAPRYTGLDPDGKPISPQVARGREIYRREGCFYCHTQQVRTVENDSFFRAPRVTLKNGETAGDRPTRPGDYAYDNPVLLGTERTGPDLKYVGHRWPSKDWHIAHLKDPRSTTPGSVMPSYAHLPDDELDALAEYLVNLRDWAISVKSLAKYPGPDILQATDAILPEEYKDARNPFKPGDPTATASGKQLADGKGCLACHGQDMKGKDAAKGWPNRPYPPSWYAAADKHSEQFIYWVISEGTLRENGAGSGMPAWKALGLTDEERWAITTYIKSLQGKQ